MDDSNILFGKTPKINFILTRLPFIDEPSDKAKENAKKLGAVGYIKKPFSREEIKKALSNIGY